MIEPSPPARPCQELALHGLPSPELAARAASGFARFLARCGQEDRSGEERAR
ncbi:hypothetical protein [Streptomyces sp. NPDC090025]|uniref:hypothetical protein n=1 Tax=Streptomyces sp. NPDC090025 TaxID=3365922 RepID=UPI0038372F3E